MTKTNIPKVYVASSLANWARVINICDKLRESGIEITYDWSKWGKQLFGEGTEVKPEGINPEEKLCEIGKNEVEGVENAHALLAIMPGERGSHFEMGIAWMFRIPIILLLDQEIAKRPTSFHYLPRVERYHDEQLAIDRTVELARAFCLVEQFGYAAY